MSAVFRVNPRLVARGLVKHLPCTQAAAFHRHFSSVVPKNPNWKGNTLVNFCDEGTCIVVERFGKFNRIEQSGVFLTIPAFEKLHKVDMREMVITVEPQMAITRDNVRIELSGCLYLMFVDPYKAMYGAVRPLVASIQQAQAIMRSSVGKMELDEIFHNRQRLNQEIRIGIEEAATNWGLLINRYEVTDIVPDQHMAKSMDLQAAAERERRQQVRKAEADKEETVLLSEAHRTRDTNESEGARIRLINEAEGNAQRVRLEAEAESMKLIRMAEGQASSIIQNAEAKAKEIDIMAKSLTTPEGMAALQYDLAKNYFMSLEKLASGKGTVVVPSTMSDMSSLVAAASKTFDSIQKGEVTGKK